MALLDVAHKLKVSRGSPRVNIPAESAALKLEEAYVDAKNLPSRCLCQRDAPPGRVRHRCVRRARYRRAAFGGSRCRWRSDYRPGVAKPGDARQPQLGP